MILVEIDKLFLDSNIIIGLAKGRLPMSLIKNAQLIVSDITRLEVFGYHNMQSEEEKFLNQFFENILCIAISKPIVSRAITLRKQKSMSVGDAIIAATVTTEKIPLVTANTKDFEHMENLKIINPLREN